MIESLKLLNFQRHERLEIDFDPRITSIMGASDKGKSAIIRSLRWLALNEPGGFEFLREGADEVLAALTVDGKRIRRIRGKSRNVYKIGSFRLSAATSRKKLASC
jgi:DNA repair protein SbcC/Rad50